MSDSDRPIAVGDLVQIVNACCKDSENYLGIIFTATMAIRPLKTCSGCGIQHPSPHFYNADVDTHYAAWRLKRIPPLDELEGERTEETLRITPDGIPYVNPKETA